MCEPIIENEPYFSDTFRIEVGWYHEPVIPHPTEPEIAECPASFRCYSCLERKGRKRHFGGTILGKRICRTCFPYVDEWAVGAMIRFDIRHGFPVD